MDKEKFLKIALLSKLSFNEQDLETCLKDLSNLEEYIGDIKTQDSNAESFNSLATDISSLRPDDITPSLDQDLVLEPAIDSMNGLIKLARRKEDG